MAIKNGRYKDKKGVIRHFETNENMVVTDDGQKTLKQKISEIVESITTKISSHNTDGTAHADIRSTLALKSNKTYVDTYTLMKKNAVSTFTSDIDSGMYYVNASTDGTFPYNYGVLTVFDGGSSERTAIFMSTGNDRKTYVNYFVIGSNWMGWKEIVTTDTTNSLSEQIKNCLGFKGTPTELDSLVEEGMYNVTPSTLNSPLNGAYGKCLVFRNPDGNAISQTVFRTSSGGYDCLYIRNSYYSGTKLWTPWQQIETTTKTSFSCVPITGYTIVWQDCYVKNGIKYINLRIKKTDGTAFEAVQHAIFTTPYATTIKTPLTIIPYANTELTILGTGVQNGVLWTGQTAYITPTTTNSYGFEIKCAYQI